MIDQLTEAANSIKSRGVLHPEIAIILGTGLGKKFVSEIQNPLILEYETIPNFPVSTVESHSGELIYGDIHGKKVLAMRGRAHYYEGYSMQQITLPVRVLKMLGVKHLLISNAAGNLNRAWKNGELMLLDDHINLQTDNPLRGRNVDALGPRFPDMSQPYALYLNNLLLEIAAEKNIRLHKGVYVCVVGPNLETRAEYRFLQRIGSDAVGMSTVPEVIVANHMGMPCCAISVLTDDCDPDNLKPASLSEIIKIAEQAEPVLSELMVELIKRI